ncbi:MAG: AlpA family phage regulatory protein [Erysipelotrichia bacterium]|nr:AlpA family phage regulatory protein [Erysipelotrichia bacterium]
MRPKQISQLLGIGRSTWWLFVKNGEVSRGIKLGDRLTVWPVEEIEAFMQKKKQAMVSEGGVA